MDLGISGKRAAVAASSSGLGLGSARALAEAGVQVAICGRDPEKVARARAELPDGTVALTVDVSTVEGAASFVDQASEAMGGLDILVANAGGPPAGTFASTPLEAYLPALQLNLLSTVAMCHAAVPGLVAQGWGRIVAITSATVRQPAANLILSNTARAGATAFLKTLATEVAPHGVTVNTVQPGLHDTERMRHLYGGSVHTSGRHVPTGTVGHPDDFGAVVAFLCSQQARYVTGSSLPVDGGAIQGLP